MEESGIDRSHGGVGDDQPNSTPRTFRLSATVHGLFSLRNRFPFTATQRRPRQTQTDPPPISGITVELLRFPPYPLATTPNPYPVIPPRPMEITEPGDDHYPTSAAPLFRSPTMSMLPQSVANSFSIPINESQSHQWARTNSLRLPPLWTGTVQQQAVGLLPSRSSSWPNRRVTSSSMASSRSRSDLPYFHARNENQSSNPTVSALEKNEFGKMILTIAVPMLTGLIVINNQGSSPLFVRLIGVALSLGFACTWNGVLSRQLIPVAVANSIEQLGVVSVLVAFFGMVGSLLPVNLFWVSWLCFVFSLLPFVLSLLKYGE